MRTGILLLITLLAIACVSKRERRQSVLQAAQQTAVSQRDTAWTTRQLGATSLQVLELETWERITGLPSQCTDTATSNNGPAKRFYGRLSLYTLRTDSTTSSAGRFTERDSSLTLRTESKTSSAERNTGPTNWLTGWLMLVFVVVLLVFRLLRKGFRY